MLVFRRVEAGVSPASERSWSVLQPGIKTVPRLRLPLTKERSAAGTACSLHGVSRAA